MLSVLLSLSLLATSPAQQPDLEARAIARVQRMPASALERGLPKEPFAAWFRKAAGREAKLEWELNDCGEQTGNPKTDKGRDFPACVGATASLPDGRQAAVLVVVGTYGQGFVGQPKVLLIMLVHGSDQKEIKSLGELGRQLGGTKAK